MKLIPPLDFIEAHGSAERRVAKLLTQTVGENDAIAFHSLALTRHQRKLRAEADFVILWRGVAIVVEVKGGSVTRKDGVWIVSDSRGRSYSKAESPWEQASGAMFALRERVREALPLMRAAYGLLVVTPDQRFEKSVEWEPWEWAGPDSMHPEVLARQLDKIAHEAREKDRTPAGLSLRPLREFLRPDFDSARSLPDLADAIDGQMVALLEEQVRVLEGLEDNDRVIVQGGAGTGKTLLALEAARRAASLGLNVLFTCRSERVVAHFAPALEGSGVVCRAFDQLDPGVSFDVVVVDEGQDLMNVEDLSRFEALFGGEIDRNRWWFFLDRNNQSRIDGEFDEDVLHFLQGYAARYTLKANFRNTKNIVSQVQMFLDADLGAPLIGEGPRVEVVQSKDTPQEEVLLRARIEDLIRQGVSGLDVGVVTVQGREREILCAGQRFRLMGPRSVKGLEFKHLLAVDLQDLAVDGALQGLYVTMTRARVSLWMCASATAWRQLQSMALNSVGRADGSTN